MSGTSPVSGDTRTSVYSCFNVTCQFSDRYSHCLLFFVSADKVLLLTACMFPRLNLFALLCLSGLPYGICLVVVVVACTGYYPGALSPYILT